MKEEDVGKNICLNCGPGNSGRLARRAVAKDKGNKGEDKEQ